MRPSLSVLSVPLSTAALILLAACGGGDGGPMDPGGDPGGSNGETRTVKADPSFANDIWEILTRRGCSSGTCHGGGQGDLTMTSASGAYAALVDVTSMASGETLVIPGNADDSYLVKKLEGRQSVGARMPLNGAALDNTDLSNIRNWISQGAKNN
jgi:hypothetical protein